MCFGRCGTHWAFEREGIVPDIVTIAKGLGAGYQPIGTGSGSFQHGYTYIGHAAACAGALAVQRRLREDGLLARVAPMGELLGRAGPSPSTRTSAISAAGAFSGRWSWCAIATRSSPSILQGGCTPG